MTPQKRLFDVVLALFVGVVYLPVLAVLAVVIVATDGWPVFYVSERISSGKRAFNLVKLRTMRLAPKGDDRGVSGGDKNDRITAMGRFLRKTRFDEFPQIWNVLRGDMSLVGPRPPLRQYVDAFPDLYASVLKSRPGITGLATVVFHRHEELLLRNSKSLAETDRIYRERCVPRKARLDMIYQANSGVLCDLWIIYLTLARLFPLPGKRAARLRRRR